MATLFYPATPAHSQMLHAKVEYVHSRPYMQSRIVTTGTITRMYQYRNVWYYVITPDAPHMIEKHKSEYDLQHDLIRYLPKAEMIRAIV